MLIDEILILESPIIGHSFSALYGAIIDGIATSAVVFDYIASVKSMICDDSVNEVALVVQFVAIF